jgi:hypothetical protein
MKLTLKKLTQIIREEVENTISESERGDLGHHKRQRPYGSRDISDIWVSPAQGGSLVSLETILSELDALDLDISKTRLGWKAVVYNGSKEELHVAMSENSALADLLRRLYDAKQKITERWGSTTHRYVYPFRDRGRKENGLSVKVDGDEIIVVDI